MNLMKENVRILLLEEDYESMKGLKEHLEEQGWQIELTADEGILRRLAKERFHLILLDLMIHPVSKGENQFEKRNIHFEGTNWQKTGVEFLRRLRKGEFQSTEGEGTPSNVPVIVLSGIADTTAADESDIMEMADHYIEKPFRLGELMKQIHNSLGGGYGSSTI